MSVDQVTALRLRAITEADPGVLSCILQRFQTLNVIPRRVVAQRLGGEFLEIDIEVTGLALDAFRLVVAKVNQTPMVIVAVMCD